MGFDAAPRLLLLDDESLVTRSLQGLLEAETEWEVESFNDPHAALEAIAERRFEAVVSDYLMPKMDGLKFLVESRERQPTATRLLLTGYADKQNAIRSINEARLYYYVEKPWDNEELLLMLRNAVERSQMLRRIEDVMGRLAERDADLAQLRGKLLKAIL